MDFKTDCNELRKTINDIATQTRGLNSHQCFYRDLTGQVERVAGAPNAISGEMRANIMLAYRHLEDARMRLGKAIQAYEGGDSCYDKKEGA